MNNRYIKTKLCFFAVSLSVFSMCGCKSDSFRQETSKDSFSDIFHNFSEKDYCIYMSTEGKTEILNYNNLENASLCSKPNCKHNGNDCVLNRLNGTIPVLDDGYAYYFVDDPPEIKANDDGVPELYLNSVFCRYDLTTNTEEQLLCIDAAVGEGNTGWLLLIIVIVMKTAY